MGSLDSNLEKLIQYWFGHWKDGKKNINFYLPLCSWNPVPSVRLFWQFFNINRVLKLILQKVGKCEVETYEAGKVFRMPSLSNSPDALLQQCDRPDTIKQRYYSTNELQDRNWSCYRDYDPKYESTAVGASWNELFLVIWVAVQPTLLLPNLVIWIWPRWKEFSSLWWFDNVLLDTEKERTFPTLILWRR